MSVTCPDGHPSTTTDYCDQCGRPIAPLDHAPSLAVPAARAPDEEEDTSPALRQEPCPGCGAGRSGDDRFCEACGHDFQAPPGDVIARDGSATTWAVVAQADRAQFERFAAGGVSFPIGFVERRFSLKSPQLRIGRSRGPDETRPEIDLAGDPEDPGISRLHAALERRADGTYAVRDLGSTNGTILNDGADALEPDVAIPLAAGDRIRIGAWTTITIEVA